MSRGNPHEETLRLRDYIVFAGKQYCISTVDRDYSFIEYPFETAIFPAKDNKVTCYVEEYFVRYRTQEEAVKGHKYVCEHLAEIIMGGSK